MTDILLGTLIPAVATWLLWAYMGKRGRGE